MSWGYWGIVSGLMAMVATLFVCLDLVYRRAKGSPEARGGRVDRQSEAVTPPLAAHRRAA